VGGAIGEGPLQFVDDQTIAIDAQALFGDRWGNTPGTGASSEAR